MNSIKTQSSIFRLSFMLVDFCLIMIALIISTELRLSLAIGLTIEDVEMFHPPLTVLLISSILWVIALSLSHAYDMLRSKSFILTIFSLFFGHGFGSLLFLGFLYLTYRDFSRLQSIYVIGISLFLFVIARIILRVYDRFRNNRIYRICIIGTGTQAQELGEKIELLQSDLEICGYYHYPANSDIHVNTKNIVQKTDLVKFIEKESISEVIIAVDPQFDIPLHELVSQFEHTPVAVRLALDYSEIAYFNVSIDSIVGIPLIGLREPIFTPIQHTIKRFIDLLISCIFIMITMPIMLLVVVAIKLDSEGPAIIRQKRIGQYGIPFEMFKFRSMYTNGSKVLYEPSKQKSKNDPRITKVGKFIRQWSLDELPQLFNVIRGEMTLVGPRPELPEMVDQYMSWQRKRFEVPQGITGWWQINGRADKPMVQNTEYDLYYIANYSIWMDIRILLYTPVTIFSRRGAY